MLRDFSPQDKTCKPALGYSFAGGTIDGGGDLNFTQGTQPRNPSRGRCRWARESRKSPCVSLRVSLRDGGGGPVLGRHPGCTVGSAVERDPEVPQSQTNPVQHWRGKVPPVCPCVMSSLAFSCSIKSTYHIMKHSLRKFYPPCPLILDGNFTHCVQPVIYQLTQTCTECWLSDRLWLSPQSTPYFC